MNLRRKQLNVEVDYELLQSLKKNAIKSNTTLANYVSNLLYSEVESISLNYKGDSIREVSSGDENAICSNTGAKEYCHIASKLFNKFIGKTGLDTRQGLEGISPLIIKYNGNLEISILILTGKYYFTGRELEETYKLNGYSPLQMALQDYMQCKTPELIKAFIDSLRH